MNVQNTTGFRALSVLAIQIQDLHILQVEANIHYEASQVGSAFTD